MHMLAAGEFSMLERARTWFFTYEDCIPQYPAKRELQQGLSVPASAQPNTPGT